MPENAQDTAKAFKLVNDIDAVKPDIGMGKVMKYTTSHQGIALIKRYESFSAKPYLCPAGVPTIGYGNTVYPDGRSVTLKDKAISEPDAVILLRAVLYKYEDAVNRYVQVPINQYQFDALVDFAYNVGIGSLKSSTLLKRLNLKDYIGASNQFQKWVYADGKKLQGLVVRRVAERELFLK